MMLAVVHLLGSGWPSSGSVKDIGDGVGSRSRLEVEMTVNRQSAWKPWLEVNLGAPIPWDCYSLLATKTVRNFAEDGSWFRNRGAISASTRAEGVRGRQRRGKEKGPASAEGLVWCKHLVKGECCCRGEN